MGLGLSGFFLLLGPDVIYRYLDRVLRVFLRDRILAYVSSASSGEASRRDELVQCLQDDALD
jgi:hypothetical protein